MYPLCTREDQLCRSWCSDTASFRRDRRSPASLVADDRLRGHAAGASPGPSGVHDASQPRRARPARSLTVTESVGESLSANRLEHRRRDQDEHRWIVIWRFDDPAHLPDMSMSRVAVSRSDERHGCRRHPAQQCAPCISRWHPTLLPKRRYAPASLNSPVRSSPRRLGHGHAIGLLPMPFAACASSGHHAIRFLSRGTRTRPRSVHFEGPTH